MKKICLFIVLLTLSVNTWAQQKNKNQVSLSTLLHANQQQIAVLKKIIQEHHNSAIEVQKDSTLTLEKRKIALMKISLLKRKRLDSLFKPEQLDALRKYQLNISEGQIKHQNLKIGENLTNKYTL